MSKIIKMNEIKAELKIKKRILIIEEEPEDDEVITHLQEFPTHKYCEECECCIGCDCCMCNKCVCEECKKEIDFTGHYEYDDDTGFYLCGDCMPNREDGGNEKLKPTITKENLYDFMVINEWDQYDKKGYDDAFSYEQNYKLTKSLGFTDENEEALHDKMFHEIRLNYENFNAERSCMWVEEVKRRAKWVIGETIYGDNREKHMTYPIWWSRDKKKIGCPSFIIEADGYVSIQLFNGYTMNETTNTKKVNYIRPSCLYNDKNCDELNKK
jgi:hypothetical protein